MSFPIPLVVLRQPRASVSTQDLARAFGVPVVSNLVAGGYLPPPVTEAGRVVLTLPGCHYLATGRRWRVRDLVRCYLW